MQSAIYKSRLTSVITETAFHAKPRDPVSFSMVSHFKASPSGVQAISYTLFLRP